MHPVTRQFLAYFIGDTACHTGGSVCVSTPQIPRQIAIEQIMAAVSVYRCDAV
jgi:hypothetical protein